METKDLELLDRVSTSPAEPLIKAHREPADPSERSGRTVFVLDDHPDALLSLFEALTEAGFRAEASSSAMSGLAHIAKTRPAVVIASCDQSDMSGLEILDRIRKLSPESRVIMISGCIDWAIYEEVLRRGGSHLLSRRTSPEIILSLVEYAFSPRS